MFNKYVKIMFVSSVCSKTNDHAIINNILLQKKGLKFEQKKQCKNIL